MCDMIGSSSSHSMQEILLQLMYLSETHVRTSGVKLTDRASSGSGSGKVLQCKSMVTLQNLPPPHFGVSQSIPMDLAAAARCVHTLKARGCR